MSLTDNFLNLARIFFPSVSISCNHDRISPNIACGYCPDCGKLIQNEWYITRCACCGIKMKAIVKNGMILPQNQYCSNCGSEDFIIEKIENINFIDIKFAALIRQVIEEKSFCSTTKCWQEKTFDQPKLLIQYR